MNTKLLFVQLLIAAVSGQALDSETSPVPDYFEVAAQAGLAEPTSAWIPDAGLNTNAGSNVETGSNGADAGLAEGPDEQPSTAVGVKETSAENFAVPAATSTVLNLLGNAAEGDLHGANPRQNMVYFGLGRHGFGFGAECADCGGEPCPEERPCHHRVPEEHARPCNHPSNHPQRPLPPPPLPPVHPPREPYGPVESDYGRQPYLKVTPSQVVQTFTRTHIETGTSTSLDVSTSHRTRTVTEEVYSTQTHLVHPEKTYTYVDRHTIYEYPASTIDASQIRPAYPTPGYQERPHIPCE